MYTTVFARVVTKSPRFCHITPLIKSLHSLPVCYGVKFKLCSLNYQALTSGHPVYIRNMLQPSQRVRTPRSSDLDQLNVPRVRTAVGSRAFSVAAPRLWNELNLLSVSINAQVKRCLKHHARWKMNTNLLYCFLLPLQYFVYPIIFHLGYALIN